MPTEEHIKELKYKYPVVAKIPNLRIPRTDVEVYEQLDKGNQIVDQAAQRIQSLQAAAMTSLLHIRCHWHGEGWHG